MIVTGNIVEIVTDKAASLGIQSFFNGWGKIDSPLKDEAIVIFVSTALEPDTYWERATVHVNICVPDYLGEVNGRRLTDLERMAKAWSDDMDLMTGVFDGTQFTIKRLGLGQERDDALKCSYVNLILSFETLNVR